MIDTIASPSPNHGPLRHTPITAIVLHDTDAAEVKSTLDWFATPVSQVSAHYVVDPVGLIYRCVDEMFPAWHAGVSELHGVPDVNLFSVGIELVHVPGTAYPDDQLLHAALLVLDIVGRYQIPLNRIVGHRDIARPLGRKVDPELSPYDFLAQVGRML